MSNAKTHSLQAGGTLVQLPPPPGAPKNIIICPGGAYQWLSPREGAPVGEAFAKAGWAPWILHYSIGENASLGDTPLRQLAGAVALVRQLAPGPVATCGFSAGGHLAACLGVHSHALGLPAPDAQVLCYPVITAGPYAHDISMQNLVGEGGSTGFFCLEEQVTAQTPPTFLWHTVADDEVPVQNSMLFANALAKAGVPFEMHLFPKGVHGLSLATPELAEPEKQRHADAHVASWLPLCLEWLDETLALPARK